MITTDQQPAKGMPSSGNTRGYEIIFQNDYLGCHGHLPGELTNQGWRCTCGQWVFDYSQHVCSSPIGGPLGGTA